MADQALQRAGEGEGGYDVAAFENIRPVLDKMAPEFSVVSCTPGAPGVGRRLG